MVTIKCQYTGIEFEAETRRSKNHPEVSSLLNEAARDKRNPRAYSTVLRALEEGKRRGFTTIDEFIEYAEAAIVGEQAKYPERQNRQAQAETEAKKKMAEAKANRQAENAHLRAHNYIWKKEEIMNFDQAEEYDPRYAKFEWMLYAPDGRPISKEQALDEIERGSEVVQSELVKVIENSEELPYNIILTGELLEADNRRKQAEKTAEEAKSRAWEAAQNEIKNQMVEVEPFDYSDFQVAYEHRSGLHTGKIFQGQINETAAAAIYDYHGGHDFYQTEQYYCVDPEQAGLTELPERSGLEASWHKFFGE